jgi:RNA-directed DNA polymerase
MTSLDHLFCSWNYFRQGKRKRKDIQLFERHLEDNIFQLQRDLATFQYRHSSYDQFFVTDPKQRHISKAMVRDRLVHQAVYAVLADVFDKTFIFHSLSCRVGKGTHIGIDLLRRMIRKVSANGKLTCYALKMDIKRFFDTIDHQILKTLLKRKIRDEKVTQLIELIIDSFTIQKGKAAGLPLGNVTSQLFANVYLHELDHFVKHVLREPHYLRYCDDFLILSTDYQHLVSILLRIQIFLNQNLRLTLHPKKVTIRKLSQGIDFVGYVLFEHHTLVRSRTKRRMKQKLSSTFEEYLMGKTDVSSMDQRVQSYLGILSHANQHTLSESIQNAFWVRNSEKFAAGFGRPSTKSQKSKSRLPRAK